VSWERQITIKSPKEIAIMREAGRINALALKAVREIIQPGIMTSELDAAAEKILKKHGAFSPFKDYPGPYPYPASICVSVNEELVHGIPGDRKLKEGDIVSVDCGTVHEGFVGDSAFTAPVGKIAKDAQKLLEVTEQALKIGIQQMVAGKFTGDIGFAIQQYVESQGLNVVREYTGHGVGRNMHEGPQVPNYGEPGKGVLLRAGMTIALEPMVLAGTPYTRVMPNEWTVSSRDGRLTAHFEHSVAITEHGPEILTLP
jgi:methionyl aminopeptidase